MADGAPRIAGVQLRRAQLADAHAIALLHIASWRVAYSAELPATYLAALDVDTRAEQWRSRLARPTTRVDLAEEQGSELLGFCAHGPAYDADGNASDAWEIYSLHVRPQFRGGGVGTLLFNEGLSRGRIAGASALTLWVVAGNAPARRFYERKGMHADGAAKTRELAPGIKLNEVHYRILLTPPGSARSAR